MSILNVQDLKMCFGGLTAVNNLSFSVAEKGVFALIGPNGAGKTTVFNAVSGVYTPSAGQISIKNLDYRENLNKRALQIILCSALACGLFLPLFVNIQSLWQAAIVDNYIYRQPFAWSKAFEDALHYFYMQPLVFTLLPFLFGAAIGAYAAFTLWQNSRTKPEKIAQRGIARTFQNIKLFGELTVLENVLVGLDSRLSTNFWHSALRLPAFFREKKSAHKKSYELLDFVGLSEFADAKAQSLPYGYQRRLEIARALASDPALLMLDEPAAGLNPSECQDLVDLITRIKESGKAVLLIEHHMKVVMAISEHIVVLDYGNKIAEGNPEEIKSNPKVIEAYLGQEPEA